MNKTIKTLAMLAVLGATAAQAAIPTWEPLVSLKTNIGMQETARKRTFEMYVKSYLAGDTCYVDWGDGTAIDTVKIAKADNLTLLKHEILNHDATVRIWGNKNENIWFCNFQGNYVYDMKVRENSPFNWFNCADNPLSNSAELSKMPKLYFLNISECDFKEVNIATDTFMRLYADKTTSLETVNIKSQNLSEWNMHTSGIRSVDLNYPKLHDLVITDSPNLTSVKTYDGYNDLFSFNISSCPNLTSDVVIRNSATVQNVSFNNNPKLTKVIIENCPKMYKIHLQGDNSLEEFAFDGSANLIGLYLDETPLKKLTVKNLPNMVDFTAVGCQLDTIDLSQTGDTLLTNVKANNGTLRKIILPAGADTTITQLLLQNNRIALVDLPKRPKYIKSSTGNYKYAPQAMPQLPREVHVGDSVDMSGYLYGNGSTGRQVASKIQVTTKFQEELEPGIDYSINGRGMLKFLAENIDSVAITVTNSAFHDFTGADALRTNYTMVSKQSGISGVKAASGVSIERDGDAIVLRGAKGQAYLVTDVAGRTVKAGRATADAVSIKLDGVNGVLIVKAGAATRKLLM